MDTYADTQTDNSCMQIHVPTTLMGDVDDPNFPRATKTTGQRVVPPCTATSGGRRVRKDCNLCALTLDG